MNLDRLLGLTLLVVAALLWWVIIPEEVSGFEQGIMPRFVTILMAISSLGLYLRPSPKLINTTPFAVRSAFMVVGMMGLYILYILCIPMLGFFTSSAVLCIVSLWILGIRGRLLLMVPAGLLGSIWLIITKLLQYPLPQGFLL